MRARGIFMIFKHYSILGSFFAIFQASVFGMVRIEQDRIDVRGRALNEYIQLRMSKGDFSGAVLVAHDDVVLLSKGYGRADYGAAIPNTSRTKFRIGSVTKPFTALAIMQLQERGLLDVHDPIGKYIEGYPHGDKITIHHLLSHTSGIPNFTSFSDYGDHFTKFHTLTETIAWFKNKPLEFEPGERGNYTNSGYILLTAIIEKVSGQRYRDYIREHICRPCGMLDTDVDSNNPHDDQYAVGYYTPDNEAEYADMSVPSGAGVLRSTVGDLYKFHKALSSGKLLSSDLLERMYVPVMRDAEWQADYGYGWFVQDIAGHRAVWHHGIIHGFRAEFVRFIDDNVCIVILNNFFNAPVHDMAKHLAKIVFE